MIFEVTCWRCCPQGTPPPSLETCCVFTKKNEMKKFILNFRETTYNTKIFDEEEKKENFIKMFEDYMNIGVGMKKHGCPDCGHIIVYGDDDIGRIGELKLKEFDLIDDFEPDESDSEEEEDEEEEDPEI